MTFQELILALQNYWAKQGCIIQQPYDVEKLIRLFEESNRLLSVDGSAAGAKPAAR